MKNQKGIFIVEVLVFCLILITSCNTSSIVSTKNATASNNEKMLLLKIDSLEIELEKSKSNSKFQRFEPEKAYVRCAMPALFETVKSKSAFIVYTGTDTLQKGLVKTEVESKPTYNKWVKKKSSDLCSAYTKLADESCEVWYLEQIPAKIEKIYEVEDTNRIKEFEVKFLNIQKIVKEAVLSQFREFHCPSVDQFDLVKKIQQALRSKGYKLIGSQENIMDQVTKNALMDYQKKNNLPIGTLNFETLKSLGINKL